MCDEIVYGNSAFQMYQCLRKGVEEVTVTDGRDTKTMNLCRQHSNVYRRRGLLAG